MHFLAIILVWHLIIKSILTQIFQLSITCIFNGAGTGLGDFNNDGLEDLFFAGNKVSNTLYQNMGNLKFQDVTEKAGLSSNVWCTGVLVEDFNQDGWLDLYVSVAGEKSFKRRTFST